MELIHLPFHDIGIKIGLVGAVFGDEERTFLCMLPDQKVLHQEVLEMDLEGWLKFLRQTDLQEMPALVKDEHGKIVKAIVRKTQRIIDNRVSWQVYKRDGYRCRYCGRDGLPLTVDHLVLWEEGGPSIPENLVTACRKCNKTRGNMQYEDWLQSPYYQKVAKGITNTVFGMNAELAETLAGIPRRYAERKRR